jgi:hypothetical protein
MNLSGRTVSYHMLRRTARAKAKRLALERKDPWPEHPTHEYRVVKTTRGPWRYRVVWALKS